jgi:hypothetical protein
MHSEAQRSHILDKLAVNSSNSPNTASPHSSNQRPLRMAENRSQMSSTLRQMPGMIPWAIGKTRRDYPVPLSPIAFEDFRHQIERLSPPGKRFLIIRIVQTFVREPYSVSRLHRTLRLRMHQVCRESKAAEVVHPTMMSTLGTKTLPSLCSKIHIKCTGQRTHYRSQKPNEAAAHLRAILQYTAAILASKAVIVVTASMILPESLKDAQAAQTAGLPI